MRGQEDFQGFIADFLGEEPEADVEDFLAQVLGVARIDLEADVESTFDLTARARLTEIWRERKKPNGDIDLLLRHDVEMYLGVLAMRKETPASIFGHEAWWVTLETNALALRDLARDEGIEFASSPVMHPNFLSHLLAVGPSRRTLTNDERGNLPFLLAAQASPWGVPELSEVAADIRKQYADRPEYFLRRKLREHMNSLKEGRGPLTEGETAYT